MIASGVSNARITHKGLIKNGVNELLSIQHFHSKSDKKFRSAMVGVMADAMIKKQS